MLTSKLRKAEHDYYLQRFNNFRTDPKSYWKTIKHLMGNQTKMNPMSEVNDENVVSSRPEEFNNFFSNIGNQLESQLPIMNESQQSNYNCYNNFFLKPVTDVELDKIISNLKVVRSDLNTIPITLFKQIRQHILYPLKKIINLSFVKGTFPEALKIARITPIYKKGDVNDPSNYRPISSLHYISKILEKCVVNRLTSFCDKFHIMAKNQFGFQKGKSTCDAILNLTETIHEALENKKFNFTLMFDIKKAFDSVNHTILLKKLYGYGIRGTPLDWFKSYLSDRQCFVEINLTKSNTQTFNIGVPQGSILGPMLFLLYINDLPSIFQSANTTLFADDTTISISDPDYASLCIRTNTELERLYDWTVQNRLTLHADKTELIVYSNKNLGDNAQNLQINESTITRSEPSSNSQCKFLGVRLDLDLSPTFQRHINFVTSKISRHSGILYKIKDRLPIQARLNYYHAFVYPFLKYNVEVWGGSYPTHLKSLIAQHKRVVRNIADAGFCDHTSPIFLALNLLKFTDIYKFHVLIRMHKLRSNNCFATQHERNTRNRDLAVPPFRRLTLTQQGFQYAGPKLWNELPSYMREIVSLKSFKTKLKRYLIDKYSEPSY